MKKLLFLILLFTNLSCGAPERHRWTCVCSAECQTTDELLIQSDTEYVCAGDEQQAESESLAQKACLNTLRTQCLALSCEQCECLPDAEKCE